MVSTEQSTNKRIRTIFVVSWRATRNCVCYVSDWWKQTERTKYTNLESNWVVFTTILCRCVCARLLSLTHSGQSNLCISSYFFDYYAGVCVCFDVYLRVAMNRCVHYRSRRASPDKEIWMESKSLVFRLNCWMSTRHSQLERESQTNCDIDTDNFELVQSKSHSNKTAWFWIRHGTRADHDSRVSIDWHPFSWHTRIHSPANLDKAIAVSINKFRSNGSRLAHLRYQKTARRCCICCVLMHSKSNTHHRTQNAFFFSLQV